jgi:ribosomal protein L11 methyltransferase
VRFLLCHFRGVIVFGNETQSEQETLKSSSYSINSVLINSVLRVLEVKHLLDTLQTVSEAFRTKGTLESLQTDLLWEYGCQGVWQDGEDLVAYFENRLDLPLEGTWETTDDGLYIRQYYETLQPIYLEKLVVAPTHTQVTLKAPQKVIWLDPGMAFGTGHHETTHMALEALETLSLEGKTVLDVGSGSGILAIAADFLGATSHGIDIDAATVPVARENARLNGSRATFAEGTLESIPDQNADVIIGNLFAELHVILAIHYSRVLRKNGTLIITGILSEKSNKVKEAIEHFFELTETRTLNEWTLFRGRRKEERGK